MSFPRHLKYKPSGVEWLGEVPEHWSILPIRALAQGTPDAFVDGDWIEAEYIVDDGVRLIQTGNIGVGSYKEQGFRFVSEETFRDLHCTEVLPGDVLICRLADPVGRACPAPDLGNRMITSVDVCILKPRPDIDAAFLTYMLSSHQYLGWMEGQCRGGTRDRVSRTFLGAVRTSIPPLLEQRVIAAFLDQETAKIDALVAEQERLIELLKEKRQAVISHAVTKGLNPAAPMKPSGIEWLGDVPAHWSTRRIGSIFRPVAEEGSKDLPILSVSIHDGVSDKEMSEDELDRKVTRSEDRSKYVCVQPGDLVYNMMRAWQGAFGTVTTIGMVSPAYVVARPTSDMPTEFVERTLRTSCAIEEMRRHSKGVTDFRLRLYWDEFKNMALPVPGTSEVGKILDRVRSIEDSHWKLEAEAAKSMALLQERRSALISAAVTGQIDVRNAVPAEVA